MNEDLCFVIIAYGLQSSVTLSKLAVLCCYFSSCLANYKTDLPLYCSLFSSNFRSSCSLLSKHLHLLSSPKFLETKHVYSASFTMSYQSNHHPPGVPSTGFAQPLSEDGDFPSPLTDIGQPLSPDAMEWIPQEWLTSEWPPFEAIGDKMTGEPVPMEMNYDDFSDPFPEIGQPVGPDALATTQQESSTFGSIKDETMQQPLSMDNESANPFRDDLFQVSFASEPDLELLSKIHARASVSDPLACSIIRKPKHFDSHLEIGRFHYGQAFAAKDWAIILKAINQDSRELVGCAWLQPHIFYKRDKPIQFCQDDYPLPRCLKQTLYQWFHRQIHQHRQTALRRSGTREYGTLHYCKYFTMFRHDFQAFATEMSGQYDN